MSVIVYLDGEPVYVPREVTTRRAARQALGLYWNEDVVLQHRVGQNHLYRRVECLTFESGWIFHPEDCYVRVDRREAREKNAPLEEWEQDPEAWKP